MPRRRSLTIRPPARGPVIHCRSAIRKSLIWPSRSTSSSTPGASKVFEEGDHGRNGLGNPRKQLPASPTSTRRPQKPNLPGEDGMNTFVASWVPPDHNIIGAWSSATARFSITEKPPCGRRQGHLPGQRCTTPLPCDAAIASLHELPALTTDCNREPVS